MNRSFFAQLNENNVVIDVHCVTQEFLETNPERYPGIWVETFFDTEGKTYAGIGMIYVQKTNDFISPPSPVEPDIEP